MLPIATRFVSMFSGVLAFAWVERRMGEDHGLSFDEPVLRWLLRKRTPELTRAVLFVTQLGSGRVLTAVSIVATVALWARGNRRAARFIAITASGAGLSNQGLKALYRRERPDVTLHLSQTTGFGFPSGHAMASAPI